MPGGGGYFRMCRDRGICGVGKYVVAAEAQASGVKGRWCDASKWRIHALSWRGCLNVSQ